MKLLFLLLAGASALLLLPLVYALVYAAPNSPAGQHRLVIGLAFMATTRSAVLAYRRLRPRQA